MATATPERFDVLTDLIEAEGLYEVVSGRIVEKPMGVYENWFAKVIYDALVPFRQS